MVGKDKKVYKITNSELFERNKTHWIKIGLAWENHKGFNYVITKEVVIFDQIFNPELKGKIFAENCNIVKL